MILGNMRVLIVLLLYKYFCFFFFNGSLKHSTNVSYACALHTFSVIWSYWCFNCQSDRRERCFYTQIFVVDNTLRGLTRQNLKSLFRDLSEISRGGGGGGWKIGEGHNFFEPLKREGHEKMGSAKGRVT